MMDVAVVGEGARFRSLVSLLQQADTPFRVWQPEGVEDPPKGVDIVDLDALHQTPLVFLALPMTSLRDVARHLGDALTARHAVVHLCHNLEYATLETASVVLEEETPTHRFGFLTGPMRIEDVEEGHPASGVCATVFPEIQEIVEECLVGPHFRLYRSDDLASAEVAAAYLRVIAMAAGVAHEMGLGRSIQATLFARGLAETARVVVYRGGYERTTFGLAGAANLFVDTLPPGSSDFELGRAVCEAGTFDAEALSDQFGSQGRDLLSLVESLWAGLRGAELETHILETCHLMTSGEYSPRDAVGHLMALPTLQE